MASFAKVLGILSAVVAAGFVLLCFVIGKEVSRG